MFCCLKDYDWSVFAVFNVVFEQILSIGFNVIFYVFFYSVTEFKGNLQKVHLS